MNPAIPTTAPALPPGQREREASGLVITSTRIETHRIDDRVCWALWSETHGDYPLGRSIELSVWTPTGGWRVWDEYMHLCRHDCPLDWLDKAKVVDQRWRDRVLQWHERADFVSNRKF